MSRPDLSLDNFKKWMETQDEEPVTEELTSVKVQSKISPRKLATKMTVEEGEEEELAEDFAQNGGVVVESDSSGLLLIDVDAGRFFLHLKYVETN